MMFAVLRCHQIARWFLYEIRISYDYGVQEFRFSSANAKKMQMQVARPTIATGYEKGTAGVFQIARLLVGYCSPPFDLLVILCYVMLCYVTNEVRFYHHVAGSTIKQQHHSNVRT